MKSLEIINEEINLHEKNWAYYKKMGELKKHQDRVTFLRDCRRYIETSPTEEFLGKEIKKLTESNIRCKEKLDEIKRNNQGNSLKFVTDNMKKKIKANDKFLGALVFIQNKKTDLFNGEQN